MKHALGLLLFAVSFASAQITITPTGPTTLSAGQSVALYTSDPTAQDSFTYVLGTGLLNEPVPAMPGDFLGGGGWFLAPSTIPAAMVIDAIATGSAGIGMIQIVLVGPPGFACEQETAGYDCTIVTSSGGTSSALVTFSDSSQMIFGNIGQHSLEFASAGPEPVSMVLTPGDGTGPVTVTPTWPGK
jgi:hypothetical protein